MRVPVNGLLEKTLPDYLCPGLNIIFIGINPGLVSVEHQKYYHGGGNHFWPCMVQSGLLPTGFSSLDDYRLPEFGIGLTNMVSRTTRSSADLTKTEMKEGAQVLLKKLQFYRPHIAVFNGKEIYRIFSGCNNFCFGKQFDTISDTDTFIFVMPSSSARCSQLPRASDKLPFYVALKTLRDYCREDEPCLRMSDVTFPSNLKVTVKRAEEVRAKRRKRIAFARQQSGRQNDKKSAVSKSDLASHDFSRLWPSLHSSFDNENTDDRATRNKLAEEICFVYFKTKPPVLSPQDMTVSPYFAPVKSEQKSPKNVSVENTDG